jgi:Fe-S-cluster-containing hydrogenase component 2
LLDCVGGHGEAADVHRLDPGLTAAEVRSPRFTELGLYQGQHLMLIDLERCTRCDECVKACVNAHTDGRSRLFLDGPRDGRSLVPLTCRSCLDPVCLIGCPVGSIRRGSKEQIVIENWCIGCGACASNCPYGSIQMHDASAIPAGGWGWRFAANPGDPARWAQPGFRDHGWAVAAAPFGLSPEAQPGLLQYAGGPGPCGFRLAVTLSPAQARRLYRLDAWSLEKSAVQVWVNGTPLPEANAEKDRGSEFAFPPRFARTHQLPADALRPGRNVVAVQVTGPAARDDQRGIFFDLRLNSVLAADLPEREDVEYRLKQVTARAVVCDLCAELPQGPACVNACPHDAARRVNAWSGSAR